MEVEALNMVDLRLVKGCKNKLGLLPTATEVGKIKSCQRRVLLQDLSDHIDKGVSDLICDVCHIANC